MLADRKQPEQQEFTLLATYLGVCLPKVKGEAVS